MMIHDITAQAGKYKNRKRVGRGEGSGHGKQSGRGNKGAGSRSGTSAKKAFEGGQMPFFRRIAKFGFTNAPFRTHFWIVNLSDIVAHPLFAKGGDVNAARLIEAGLVRDESRDLKILGNIPEGGLKAKLNVTASRVSGKARQAVIDAGGSVNESGTRRDMVRGVDRNAEDRSPKKLTKKLSRGGKKVVAAKAEAAAPAEKAAKPAKAPKPAKGAEGGKTE